MDYGENNKSATASGKDEVVFNDKSIISEFTSFLTNKQFPCVAAKAALSRDQITFLVADHMACPKDDTAILNFLYHFVDEYRLAQTQFHSAVVIFKGPVPVGEAMFDQLLWMRLQALANLDATQYDYDRRVNVDPASPDFSFSLKEEAFFVIGLNPASSRYARQFTHPALVFNPHAQFEQLRTANQYGKMKNIVRAKDIQYSGSVNPMLTDFGQLSEVHQYSGMPHDETWKCPLTFAR